MPDHEGPAGQDGRLPPVPHELPPVPLPFDVASTAPQIVRSKVGSWLTGLLIALVFGLIGFAIWSFSLLSEQKAQTLNARTEAQALAEGKMSADQRAAEAESMAQAVREEANRTQRAEDAEAEVRRLRAVAEAAEKEAERFKAETSNGSATAVSTLSERAIEPSTKRGTISDPDGFTNLRLEPGTKDGTGQDVPVVQKILQEEVFEYTPNNSDWWPVRTSDGKEGFVHKSRIVEAENNPMATEQSSTTREKEVELLERTRLAAEAESIAQAALEKASLAQREKEEEFLERTRLADEAARVSVSSSGLHGSQILDYDEARRRADSEDAYAQAILAIYYSVGYKAEKDLIKAANYAIKSAQQKHPLGVYRLGVMIENGDALKQDAQLGLDLKIRALAGLDSMVGDPYAMTSLGVMLWRGQGVAQNKNVAANLYRKAADMGYAPAQYNYAACLLVGQGVRKNQAEGMRYWERAVQQNYALALEGPPL